MKEFKLSEGSSVFLDFVRGVSAQLVVLGHGIYIFGVFPSMQATKFPSIQDIAVLVFFLLSGFLITYSTVRKMSNVSGYGFKHFFFDRFSRIYTAFFFSLIVVALLDFTSQLIDPSVYLYGASFDLQNFIGNMLMLQDYPVFAYMPSKIVTTFGSARPFWTLAIEWWIYLFFGYLMLVIFNKKKVKLPQLIVLGFFSVVPLFNLIYGRGNGLTTYWVFGAIAYLLMSQNILDRLHRKTKWIIALLLLLLAGLRIAITMEEYEPIFAFLLALALLFTIDIFKNFKFSERAIKLIRLNASFSYTLYLVHFSILELGKAHFTETIDPYIIFLGGFIVSNIISLIIGHYSETILTPKVKAYLYKRSESKTS